MYEDIVLHEDNSEISRLVDDATIAMEIFGDEVLDRFLLELKELIVQDKINKK